MPVVISPAAADAIKLELERRRQLARRLIRAGVQPDATDFADPKPFKMEVLNESRRKRGPAPL